MKILAVNVYRVNLPFTLSFSHSQKIATSSENIVVEVLPESEKAKGYGEGAPREYVTGETQDSAILSVMEFCSQECFPWDLRDVSQIWHFVDCVGKKKNQNAALCALEMALLDSLGKEEEENISNYLPKGNIKGEVRYGAIIPLDNEDRVASICRKIKEYDIKEIRLKMGRDFQQNQMALRTVREIVGADNGLRVDVNGAWDLDMCKSHLQLLESYGVTVLEQPMLPNSSNWHDAVNMFRRRNIKLMADESVCSITDLERAISEEWFDLINVRLSKCGGFSKSLGIIELIRSAELEYQIGCQLGESGFLSAAGRALCFAVSDAKYCDGSYDEFLLSDNITTEHISFGHGGVATRLDRPGLGIDLNMKNFSLLSEHRLTIRGPRSSCTGPI